MRFQRTDGSIYEIKFHSINEYRKLKILFIVNLMLKWIVGPFDSWSAKRNPKEFDFDSERAKYLVLDILQAHL